MPRLCVGGGVARKVWVVSTAVLERAAPHVGRFHPDHGPVEGGDPVVIFGAGFDDGTRVYFGGGEAEVEEILGSGILIARVPPGEAAGEVAVRVTTSRGDAEGEPRYRYVEVRKDVFVVERSEMSFHHLVARSARSLGAAAGDFNGDSLPDVALVDSHVDGKRLHIAFGTGEREGRIELELLTPLDGATIDVPITATSLVAGGDIDGDGSDDLLVRLGVAGGTEWRAVLGREEFPEGALLADLPGTSRLFGASLGHFADTAAIVPDLTGDGIDELLLTGRDELYIVKGRPRFPEDVSLDGIAETGEGATYETGGLYFGSAAGSAGDFNGDGVLDIFFAGWGSPVSGAAVILYGGADLFPGRRVRLEKSLLGDLGGLLVTGRAHGADGNHFSGTVPGDLDGDGTSELFFNQSNFGSCTFSPSSGEGFLLDRETILREGFSEEEFPSIVTRYGSTDIGLPDFSLGGGPPGSQQGVLTIQSDRRDENIGASASPAGDFNGDGYADLVIGGVKTNAYVIFGGPDLFDEPLVDLSNPGHRALTLDGEELDEVAGILGGGFDWDRDGVDDILLGSENGRVDIVFGDTSFGRGAEERVFVRGDADGSGTVNMSDGVLILEHLFAGRVAPACLDALDADDDGAVALTDAIRVLRFLFAGGPAPLPPYPETGRDPTADELHCR